MKRNPKKDVILGCDYKGAMRQTKHNTRQPRVTILAMICIIGTILVCHSYLYTPKVVSERKLHSSTYQSKQTLEHVETTEESRFVQNTTVERSPGGIVLQSMMERVRMLRAEHDNEQDYQKVLKSFENDLMRCLPKDKHTAISCSASCSLPDYEWLRIKELQDKKIFLGFNLHDNEVLMPHFLTEIMQFLLLLKPENVFVSAYESGSKDFTPLWMELLDKMLDRYNIAHRVLYGDYEVRIKSRRQHRIHFLANVRNKVLEPLAVHDGAGNWKATSVGDKVEYLDALSSVAKDENGNPMRFDQILFINDVYFCTRDLLHLLEHEADLACGLDFYPSVPNHPQECIRNNSGFYDIWVARDILGRRMNNCPPYFNDLPDVEENVAKGLPVPVQCCWNGMVAMNAEPFHKGLRFRYVRVSYAMQKYYLRRGENVKKPSEMGEECSASECSLLCKDLWFNNYTNIILDPAVKVSYQQDYNWFKYNRTTTWPIIDYASRYMEMQKKSNVLTYPPPEEVECCPMKTISGFVGNILQGPSGTCYNETTADLVYKKQSPNLFLPFF